MRILQLNTYCGIKSTGRIALTLAQQIEQNGGVCRIGYGVPQISSEAEPYALQIGSKISRKVHGAMRKWFDAEGYGSIWDTYCLLKEIDRFQPDIIHLHNIHGCYLNHGLLFTYIQKNRIPLVWTLHDCWPFTGHCAYYDAAACTKWKESCSHCPQKHCYPVCTGLDGSARNHRRKKRLFRLPQRIHFVAPCHWMKEQLAASFLGAAEASVIINGIDKSIFTPTPSSLRQQWPIGKRKLILGVASEWDERKGFAYLLQAAQRLGDAYCFAVVGLTDKQAMDLPKNMLAVPSTHDAKSLAAWYTAADCFANPTLEDNMPTVNLEALACGTPVVAFDTGGCAEAIGDCGCVVRQGDMDAFCEKLKEFCDKKSIITDACLVRSEQFGMESMGKAYIKLYEEMMK